MAEIVLTPGQRAAVESRGCALLVAAAAGSGKTRVLIDRVLDQVIREGRHVDEFLLITFTQAAAAELRGKLLAELNRRLAADPENRHLQRQLSRVYLAQISTVHSFCAALLRDYAHTFWSCPPISALQTSRRQPPCGSAPCAPFSRRPMPIRRPPCALRWICPAQDGTTAHCRS